ncbi:hypothetical protein E1263_10410 [Kribbella antibiotica]|uniref:Uncharacterized protein n=1 Tax=Kribbella antibiotica TaxID=190195 RepID=A0A4R4ZRX4_9ACTN|nr:hypothetical protein [Kribbella antibiotica]TDD60679.1 hypothetical protein E1263_10410 [Kribbella antibiotica]
MTRSDEEVQTALEDLFAGFETLIASGQETSHVVRRMVAVTDTAAEPGVWREALAEELLEYLRRMAPEDDDEWTASALSCLDAVCELVRISPRPEMAWALIVRATSTKKIRGVEDLTWIIEHADQIDRETVADAYLERARSRPESEVSAAVDDWTTAFAMVTEPEDQIGCAVNLAIAYADLEQPIAEAEWSWQAAILVEISEPSPDLDLLQEAYAAQFRAVEYLHRIDGSAKRMRPLLDRMLSRSGWAPDGLLPPHIHIVAAGICIQDNDAAAALVQLNLGEHRLGEVEPYFQAEWLLCQMECAVMRSDSRTGEHFARRAWPLIEVVDDEEQRTRFRYVIAGLGTVTGPWSMPGDDLAAVRMLSSVLTRMRAGTGGQEEIELLDCAIQDFDPMLQAHLMIAAYALRARINSALGRVADAADDLHTGRVLLTEIEADPPGGFPRGISTMLEQSEAIVEVVRGHPEAGALRLDEIWRAELEAGAHSAAIGAALAAGQLWLSHVPRPHQAVESAVAALTIAQELRYARGDSKDRSALATYVMTGHALAIEAVSRLGDCRLMAELLEVIRAQSVPYVSDDPGVASGPLESMLTEALSGEYPVPEDEQRSSAVLLSPPPLIVMPWGSVAMAPWLQYDEIAERPTGRLVLADL